MKNHFIKSVTFIFCLLLLATTAVAADRGQRDKVTRSDRTKSIVKSSPDYRIDKRFDHNRSYPREGVLVKRLPDRRYPIRYKDRSYFYFGGTWYLPSGPSYVVVRPPIGIIVPILPAFYTTLWFGGVPYYYANDIYYVWRPDLNGYQVTEPPVDASQPPPPVAIDELFVYPKQGQSEEKQAADRYACHTWAVKQTGYDPVQPPGNMAVDQLNKLREDYRRAMKACLEGRGYSVR